MELRERHDQLFTLFFAFCPNGSNYLIPVSTFIQFIFGGLFVVVVHLRCLVVLTNYFVGDKSNAFFNCLDLNIYFNTSVYIFE